MDKKAEILRNLSEGQKAMLLDHFNTIYECTELGDREQKMIYLAWMWANGLVWRSEDGWPTFEECEAGVSLKDYDIDIEDEMSGGVNLDLSRRYYDLDKVIEMFKKK